MSQFFVSGEGLLHLRFFLGKHRWVNNDQIKTAIPLFYSGQYFKGIVSNGFVRGCGDVGDMLIVNEGLKAGDKVVIDAIQKVRSGMVVNPQITVFESQSNIQE